MNNILGVCVECLRRYLYHLYPEKKIFTEKFMHFHINSIHLICQQTTLISFIFAFSHNIVSCLNHGYKKIAIPKMKTCFVD